MPKIFGRDAPGDHPLEAKLSPLDSAAGADVCVAENWRCDWRVSPPREQAAVEHLGAGIGLAGCYSDYYDKRICHGAPSEYVHDRNRSNLVPGMRRDTELVRVVCLNALRGAAVESLRACQSLPPGGWGSWLDTEIERANRERGVLGVRDLLSDLFQAWNKWSRIDQRPAWASFYADIADVLALPEWADRMRDAFGLGKVESGKWIVVLRYQMREATPSYRPTCLDGGWMPWHIVSPPGEPTGFAMDISPGGGRCCPEMIHAPRELKIAHWTGHIGRTATAPKESDLALLRRRHYELLRARFPASGGGWLPATAP